MRTSPALRYSRAQSLPEFDAYSSYNYLDMYLSYGSGSKLLDKSPFHSHGDITTASWSPGLHHFALDFNQATPDFVEIPASHTQLNFISEDFSVILRVKLDSVTGNMVLLIRGSLDIDGYEFFVVNGGGCNFLTYQSGASQVSRMFGGTLTIDTWYTLGVSRSGTSIRVYKDGVDTTNEADTHINPTTSSKSMKVGISDNKSSSPIDGKIEFQRIFGGISLPATAHLWFHNMLK